MDDLATNFDAIKLADRLHGAKAKQYWLHIEAEGSLEKYPAKQHARRVRERLHVAEGLIYLPGAPARSNEDSDMPAPFRQRRYFYYLSGCNEASCHLAYDMKRDILTLFIPRVNPDRVFWNGRGSTRAEAMDKYDIDEVFYADQVETWIHDWFLHYRYDGSQRLYILHKDQIPPLRFPWPTDSTSLQPAINQCRMVKDEHEIKLIRRANDISSKAHKQVLANITNFHNEAQVEGLFLNICISNQAKQQAYDPIAASGPNAGTLHYDANNEDFGNRQLMCLDAGCEFELYASDITRTFPLSTSWPSKEAENIYKLVERMQDACIQKLAPGVRYLDLHVLAHQIAIDGLLKLGILHNGTREEIYKAGTSKAFFPHGLGHHVGLEVHDVGQRELMSLYKHAESEKVPSLYPADFHLPVYDEALCMAPTDPQSPHLEEGMVVTVEPGIYFSAYALSHFYLPSPVHAKYINTEVLYRYFPVGGVRIEDDILITSKSYENLTVAPKGDEMFAIIRGQDTSSPLKPRGKKMETPEEPLRCAPGISRHVANPLLKPVSRAATEPIPSTRRASPGYTQALHDHWLFRDQQKPAQSIYDDNKDKSQRNGYHAAPAPQDSRVPLCGTPSAGIEHVFMGWQYEPRKNTSFTCLGIGTELKAPKCQQCVVLFETVDRLRETLSRSTKTSPKTSPRLGTGEFEPLNTLQSSSTTTRNNALPVRPDVPEMQQITTLPSSSFADKTLRKLSAPGYGFTSSSGRQRGMNSEMEEVVMPLPQPKTQRRSVTFDDLLIARPQSLSTRQEDFAAPSDWYTKSTHPTATAQTKSTNQLMNSHSESQKTSSDITNSAPMSKWNFTNLSEHVSSPLPVQAELHSSTVRQVKMSPDTLARGSFPAALGRDNEREQYEHSANALHRPDARPSLPNLRQGSLNVTRRDDTAAMRRCFPDLQSRQSMFVPVDASAKDQDLNRRRSIGSALTSSADGNRISQSQLPLAASARNSFASVSRTRAIAQWNNHVAFSSAAATPVQAPYRRSPEPANRYNALPSQRIESIEKNTRPGYGRSRPGGEELRGVDYAAW